MAGKRSKSGANEATVVKLGGKTTAPAAEPAPSAATPPPPLTPPPLTAPPPTKEGGTVVRRATPAPAQSAPTPANADPLCEGVVLANMFRIVKRIDSGGMGRVWEAVGVHDQDRVAIKTILPELASDTMALELFKQEAGRLTRIEHPAVAPYRGFFKDTALDTYFIVTKFIGGSNLADVLSQLRPQVSDIVAFGRRMAAGLEAAHSIGSIHCDVKPRNILLEGGTLARARLIDFGIGHDLAGDGSPIGDGFAGTYSFAAPEQFEPTLGAIGPWTDEYSLGLVLLALFRGHNADMGGDEAQALAARRKGPDLEGLPRQLRAVIERMTAFEPKARYGSMDALARALERCNAKEPAFDAGAVAARAKGAVGAVGQLPKRTLAIGGGVAAVALVGIGALALLPGSEVRDSATAASNETVPVGPAAKTDQPIEARAQTILAAAAGSAACSWAMGTATPAGNGVQVALTGAAPSKFDVQRSVEQAFRNGGIAVTSIDMRLLDVDRRDCLAIDTLRAFRDPAGGRLQVERQSTWEIGKRDQPLDAAGTITTYAQAMIQLTMADPSKDFALLAISQGEVDVLADSRATAENDPRAFISRGSNDGFQIKVPALSPSVWGIALITGTGPFPADVLKPAGGKANPAWAEGFTRTARERGWKVETAWYAVVDEQPN